MSDLLRTPHQILNLKLDASPDDVRQAYLALVRLYPPDRNADKFREIHSAYQMLSDPLILAKAMVTSKFDRPNLLATIESAEKIRPRLSPLTLLSLGNTD